MTPTQGTESQPVQFPQPFGDDYVLVGLIGRGGMGAVYRAYQKSLRREVALKVIAPGRAWDDEAVQRFRLEAQAAARLRHPNIVSVHHVGIHEGQNFFTMDLVDGSPLSKHIHQGKPSLKFALETMEKVARAVHYAHTQGIIHRDLKPDNILVDKRREPLVTDFGLAKDLETEFSLSVSAAIMGTPSYMSPEQAQGRSKHADARSDVYSLGAVLYELLVGRPPSKAPSLPALLYQILEKEPIPPRQLRRWVPPDVETICLKCLRKEPEGRYQSGEELADDIRRYLHGEPIAARPSSVRYRAQKYVRRHRTELAAVAGALVVVAAVLAWRLFAPRSIAPQTAQVKPGVATTTPSASQKTPEGQEKGRKGMAGQTTPEGKGSDVAKGTVTGPKPSRFPRVEITYDVALYGKEAKINLPFVIGVLADLSGKTGKELPPVAERKFLDINKANFDARLAAAKPRVAFRVPDRRWGQAEMDVDITFESMADFSPEGVRQRLVSARVTRKDEPKIGEQIALIMAHDDFRTLEGTWRGLHYLVSSAEPDETLKIRILNITRKELAETLSQSRGDTWDQSPLFKKVYEMEYGTPGGEPYGCLIGDYYFNHTAPDIELLSSMAKIAGAAQVPFLAGADPSLLGIASWQEISKVASIEKVFEGPDYAAWRTLRQSESSRYLALAMPRLLARLPYGEGAQLPPQPKLPDDSKKHVWFNAAYAAGSNIARAFRLFGWCTRFRGTESGGIVEALPVWTFPTDTGRVDLKCMTEVAITESTEAQLCGAGLMPLSHYRNTDFAVFFGAQSLCNPPRYEDSDATASAKLGRRLDYLLPACRFAHYAKCIVRDKIGSMRSPKDMEDWLNRWLAQYVEPDWRNAADEAKARRPLLEARVKITEPQDRPGYVICELFLLPYYQLEGLTAPLRLTTRLPSPVRRK